jgi:hypothetical protein
MIEIQDESKMVDLSWLAPGIYLIKSSKGGQVAK